jgi:hypothetical protein
MVDPVHADIDRRVEVIDGQKDSSVRRVSDLRALSFVVLLGEPGIGKSTVLGARPDSHRDGQLLQGSRLRLPLRG